MDPRYVYRNGIRHQMVLAVLSWSVDSNQGPLPDILASVQELYGT